MTPVILPPTMARCPSTRTGDCWQASHCARAQAPQEINRPNQDYTQEKNWGPMVCLYFVPLSACKVTADGPTVHEAPKGFA